jgi:hypothetical protein
LRQEKKAIKKRIQNYGYYMQECDAVQCGRFLLALLLYPEDVGIVCKFIPDCTAGFFTKTPQEPQVSSQINSFLHKNKQNETIKWLQLNKSPSV